MSLTTTQQWTLSGSSGPSSLTLSSVPIPDLGPHDVLVQIRAVALNSRDVQIANGTYVWRTQPGVALCSDAAGTVLRTGPAVTRFAPGARVATVFHPRWTSGPLRDLAQLSQPGATEDGVLRRHAVLNEQALVAVPALLSDAEAAALPCAGVTAWNALFGGARGVRPGDTVLTQGSGGVSLFAVQFARAAGARVVATTGGAAAGKAARLEALGAHAVVDYRADPEWGRAVKQLTPQGRGVDFVVEVSGAAEHSARAVALGGQIAVVGGVGGGGGNVFDMRQTLASVRRVVVGSRDDFEEMNRAIEVNGIRPVIDSRTFAFEEAKEAFEYMASQKAFGKVVITIE